MPLFSATTYFDITLAIDTLSNPIKELSFVRVGLNE